MVDDVSSVSTWPNIMVAVVLNPIRWAFSQTSSHWSVVALRGAMTLRTDSVRISAPPPGMVRIPASHKVCSTSATGTSLPIGHENDLCRAERMDVHMRADPADGRNVGLPVFQTDMRMVAALEQHRGRTFFGGSMHLFGHRLRAEQIRVRIAWPDGKRHKRRSR
jgi:hypothetical protein